MRGTRQYAIDRSKLAKQAKPLGDLIAGTARARREVAGVTPPPPPPVVPVTKPKRKTNSKEAVVLRDCLKALHAAGLFVWRNNTGTLWANGQPVSFGTPGSPDILGILPDGRFFGVECKSITGKQSAKQKKFEQRVRDNNGVYILARCVAGLDEVIALGPSRKESV